MNHRIYKAKVYHKRFFPKANAFSYPVFFIHINFDKLEDLGNRFFNLNSWNILSFYFKDHGKKDGSNPRAWVNDQLKRNGISPDYDRIELLTFPRVLGFVFKPVSFWFLYKKNEIGVILCEVNNTFGESHTYVLTDKLAFKSKEFFVSPFYEVEGGYRFDFTTQDKIRIDYYVEKKLQLLTSLSLSHPRDLNSKEVVRRFIKNPLMTFSIVFFIHYQALKLFLKKVKYISYSKYKEVGLYEHSK